MQPAHRFCHSQLLTGYRTQNVPQHFTGKLTTGCSLLVSYYFILLSAGGRRLYQCRIFHHLLQWIEAPSHPGEQGDARWGCLVLAKLSLVSGAVLPPADGDSPAEHLASCVHRREFSRVGKWNYSTLRTDAILCEERKPEGYVKLQAIMCLAHEQLQTQLQNWRKSLLRGKNVLSPSLPQKPCPRPESFPGGDTY